MPHITGSGLGTAEVKRRHILPKALVVGLTAGLVASAFRLALQSAENGRINLVTHLPTATAVVVATAIGAVTGGLGLWLVRQFAPEAAGSGIPHLMSVVLGERVLNWRRVLPVKFLAGVLGIGGGLALGREGPTIQMGGATGLMVSGWFRIKPGEGERKALISAGAGAGLAAAFNAPLAGMIFVLEELQGNFTPVVFVAAFLAAVSSDVVCRVATGDTPVFPLGDMAAPTLSVLPVALVLGALAGLGGVLFNRSLLASLAAFKRLQAWPSWAVGALAGGIVGLVGGFYPLVVGGGGALVGQAMVGQIAMRWLPLLLFARFGLSMISYGSGAAGGIFAPLLVLGAFGGLATGGLAHVLVPSLAPHPAIFAVLGMGALLTAIVRAPLTGIVLMIELTGVYGFMLPLLVCCLAAYGVAEAMGNMPIYEELRLRGNQSVAGGAAAVEEAR